MTTSPPGNPLTRRDWIYVLAIGGIAFVVRLESVLHAGGFHAVLGYDEGVYFGASTSLVNGLLPYRDFILVHPPGSLLLLSPFAMLGRLTTDSTGWAAARVFVMLVGAVNAALIVVIGRRVSLVAGLSAGLLYAVWAPVVHVERTTMLEAFVLCALIVALWALRRPDDLTWRVLVAGAALGIGGATKLWGLVPLIVIAGWLVLNRAWRSLGWLVAASAAAFTLIVAPFAAIAGHRMFDLVILDQLDRGRGGTHELERLARMFNVDLARFAVESRRLVEVGVVAAIIVIAAMILAWWKVPTARLWVSILLVQSVVLLVVPVYFAGYSSFIGPALVLVVGSVCGLVWAALGQLSGRWRPAARVVVGVGFAAFIAANAFHGVRTTTDLRPHLGRLKAITADARCVGSDSAGLLLVTDTLSRNIQRGCPTELDFDGAIYSFNDGSNPQHLPAIERRRQSAQYQQYMRDYFAANDVVLMHRAPSDGFDAQTRRAVHARPLLYHQKGLHVYGPAGTAVSAPASSTPPARQP